jgi:hypothetical protein
MASRLLMGGLVLVSALALATRAHAGFSIQNPVPGGVCASMDVEGQMSDPNNISVSGFGIKRGQCASACAAATNECKIATKENFACQAQVHGRMFGFEERGCVIDDAGNPVAMKTCITNVKDNASTSRLTLRSDLLTALGNCDTLWGAVCLNDCILNIAP